MERESKKMMDSENDDDELAWKDRMNWTW